MSNFEFLGVHFKALATLGSTPEKIFPLDPTGCVFKLRLLAEAINQNAAARLQAAHTAAERLRPPLLTKAFRGEIVPQDPSDEPATALLRRLRESRAAEGAAQTKSKRGRQMSDI